MTQVGIKPPTFVLFTKNADALHYTYERYLINRMREAYGFEGSPIRLRVRESRRKEFPNQAEIDDWNRP